MNSKFETQIKEANQYFKDIVWNDYYFRKYLEYKNNSQIGQLTFCELSQDELSKKMDTEAGIDAIHSYQKYTKTNQIINVHQTMAIRVRKKNWKSFTIRLKSSYKKAVEYDKRIVAIQNNCLYPSITIQAHIENNRLKSVAIIDTKPLYEFIHCNFNIFPQIMNHGKNPTTLLVVDWAKLMEYNIPFLWFEY